MPDSNANWKPFNRPVSRRTIDEDERCWRQFDATAITIRLLVWLRLAKNVKLPRPELVTRRLADPSATTATASTPAD